MIEKVCRFPRHFHSSISNHHKIAQNSKRGSNPPNIDILQKYFARASFRRGSTRSCTGSKTYKKIFFGPPQYIGYQKKTSNLRHACGVISKRAMSSGIHLRGFAPGQYSSEETSQQWRAVGDTMANLTGPGIKLQTFQTDSDDKITCPHIRAVLYEILLVLLKILLLNTVDNLFVKHLAPDVFIRGELTVIENDDLTVTCEYVDVLPHGNKSAFYFGEIAVNLDKVCIFS